MGTLVEPSDGVFGLAPDGAGGTYLAGYTGGSLDGPGAGGLDGWIAREDAAGNRLWTRQYGGDQQEIQRGLAADGAGAFAAGIVGRAGVDWDVYLTRYDGAGNALWYASFGAGAEDAADFAVSDGAGGVYVGGSTDGDLGGIGAGGVDAWLARYDALGNRLWIRQLGTTSFDVASAGAPDGAGGLYVVGTTGGDLGGPPGGAGDAWIARFDSAGNTTFLRQIGTTESEGFTAAASDGAGGVLACGTASSSGGPLTRITRFDAAGNQGWSFEFAVNPDTSDITCAAPDGQGGLFLGGVLGLIGNSAGWLARVDDSGALRWIRVPRAGTTEIFVFALAEDGMGGTHVGGYTWGALADSPTGDYIDAVHMRYDGNGNRTWIEHFGADSRERTCALAADGAGGAYAVGVTNGSPGGPATGAVDAWVARHAGAGDPLWIRQLGTREADEASAVTGDGGGGAFVAGTTRGSLGGTSVGGADAWIARYDGAGGMQWIRQLGTSGDDDVATAAEDGVGGAYVAGTTTGSLGAPSAGLADAWVARIDGAGNTLWIAQLGTAQDDLALAAAADGLGGVYVGGATDGDLGGASGGGTDAWLARIDAAGATTWIRQVGTGARDVLAALAPRPGGGVYLGGDTDGDLAATSAGGTDAWLARADAAGTLLWTVQLGTPALDTLAAAATDGSGGVYVGGTTLGNLARPPEDRDAWLARYEPGGSRAWLAQFGTWTRDSLLAAAPDGSGGVITGGATGFSAFSGDENPWLARNENDCGTASATARNAGANAASLAATAPVLGGVCDVGVDLSTTGHAMAILFACDGAVDLPWHSGMRVLVADLHGHGVLLREPRPGPLALYSFAVPVDPALCGFELHLQAAHLGGLVPIVLSNAQDLVIGR